MESKLPVILVTGGKGQLGLKVKQLLSKDYKLVLTDTEEMDITDKAKVFKVISEIKPDFIIHGAAYTRVDDAEEKVELCRKVNAEGTKNIAMAAKENGAILIYISTDFVFNGDKATPYSENDHNNPESIYAKTKLEGENYIRENCEKYYILRTSWLFGELPEDHPGTNFVEAMLKLAKERDSLSVVNDQIGSPTYTGDLVEVITKIINSHNNKNHPPTVPYGTYHVSGTGECSWYDFAKEIFEQTNRKINLKPISSNQYPQKAKRPTYSYLDKEKIEKTLNIKIRPWQEMLADYLRNRIHTNNKSIE